MSSSLGLEPSTPPPTQEDPSLHALASVKSIVRPTVCSTQQPQATPSSAQAQRPLCKAGGLVGEGVARAWANLGLNSDCQVGFRQVAYPCSASVPHSNQLGVMESLAPMD